VSYYGGGYQPFPEPEPEAEKTDELQAQPVRSPAGSTALLVVLVSVLVVVLCGGGVAGLYLLGTKDRQPTGSAAATGPATPTPANRSPSASPSAAYDPTSIIKGNCVVNTGTDDTPVLKVVACGPGTFQVLAKFDGTNDVTKCKQIPSSTHHYFYETTPKTLDFVLCLKKL
jgi:hypothetical protein